jgi:4-amino-4-deoxychorismate lyase
MCRLIETIRLENGLWHHPGAHALRMNHSRRLLFDCTNPIDPVEYLQFPSEIGKGRFKCRIEYDRIVRRIDLQPYRIRQLRKLRFVEAGALSYEHKFADRSGIESLFARRGDADDVLMVIDGLIADTSYSNVAFYDGRCWYTPARPLLQGTMRARLLREGMLQPADIRPADTAQYQYIALINAMLDLGELTLGTHQIVW